METIPTCTSFTNDRLLASGRRGDVALAVKAALQRDDSQTILIFDDRTGRQIDFDLRGTDQEIMARLEPSQDLAQGKKRPSGRPKLGVVAREITLLPRHWEWLAEQSGGASATLRKLVDAARNSDSSDRPVRQAQQAADRFMSAMLGNQPGYEEAARALYSGNRSQFLRITEAWPIDLRDHARRLADPALPESG